MAGGNLLGNHNDADDDGLYRHTEEPVEGVVEEWEGSAVALRDFGNLETPLQFYTKT